MNKLRLPALAAAILFMAIAITGCDGDDGDADAVDATDVRDEDTQNDTDAAEDVDVDDGAETDGPVACISDFDCSNEIFCDGREKCIEGTCYPAQEPECIDDHDCTVESCDEETRTCNYEVNHDICNDGLFCNGDERCSILHGCVSGTVPDCTDDDICTIDLCVEERGGCVHDQRDLDDDGYIDSNCGGDDCNDRDREVNPGMEEICDDGKDNDCNMAVDMADEACRPGNDTCSDPILLSEDVEILGSTYGTMNNYDSDMCYIYSERDVTFQIDLAEERDLLVHVASVTAGSLNVSIQTICGNHMSELTCQETSTSMTIRRNRLPAGTYYLIVWTDHEGDFNISYTTEDPTPRPDNDTCDGATDVAGGGTFPGTTCDCLNDFVPTCMSSSGYDTFYTFTTTEPKKITITASALSGYPTVVLALMTTCGDSGSELECVSSSGSTTMERNFLEAGTYWIAVDIAAETEYNLVVTFDDPIYPPPNDRCDGAIDISGGGIFVGNLMESYRDYTTSCSLTTYTDVAYTITTGALHDVSVTLSPIGASADMALAVVTDCDNMDTEVRCRRGIPAGFVLRSLPAGTYYIIVSGTLHGSDPIRGRFLLEVDIADPTPVPPNDSCLGAEDISSGGTFIGSTIGTFDDYDTDCGPSNYYDVVYTFTLDADSDVILDVDPDTLVEVALELQRTCGNSSSLLDCTSSTLGEMHAHGVPAGTYYLVVDIQAETDFNMEVTFGPPTSICDGSTVIDIDLSGGSFSWSDSGSTTGETNDFETMSCGYNAQSPDVPYILNVPERANVIIEDITPTSFDTVLHLRSLCDSPASELYCNDDGGSCSFCSMISAILEPGIYYIIQDGYGSGSSGNYTLSVQATPSP